MESHSWRIKVIKRHFVDTQWFERNTRCFLYVYVFAAAASEPEASEQGSSPNLYVYVLYICR
jgi:hypothetical protein